jgi:hypothetical protein
MIRTVVVRNNSHESRLHMLSPLVSIEGFSPRAVVSGFFYCHFPTAVLHTIVRLHPEGVEEKGYMVCRKARGQFPNNPCDWSNHQVEGRSQETGMMMPQGGETPSLSTPLAWGRGVFG